MRKHLPGRPPFAAKTHPSARGSARLFHPRPETNSFRSPDLESLLRDTGCGRSPAFAVTLCLPGARVRALDGSLESAHQATKSCRSLRSHPTALKSAGTSRMDRAAQALDGSRQQERRRATEERFHFGYVSSISRSLSPLLPISITGSYFTENTVIDSAGSSIRSFPLLS